MTRSFNQLIDRRCSDSMKWRNAYYPINAGLAPDVLPMWIADMDFQAAEPVTAALHERVDHGVFGYGVEPPEVRDVVISRLQAHYGWHVDSDALVFLPGVMIGVHLACHAFASTGDGALMLTPGYDSLLAAPATVGLARQDTQLVLDSGRYLIDFNAFEKTITPRSRLFIQCNPHNPVGRVYERAELEKVAEICLRHRLIICSDEIHCDFVYDGRQHLPIASLDPEIAQHTITLMGPQKTFNLAGLHCGYAIIPNPALRQAYQAARRGLVSEMNVMSYVAMMAAYCQGQAWQADLLRYLEGNRNFAMQYVRDNIPGMRMHKPEGTYLAWLDCRGTGIGSEFHNVRFNRFLFEQARVAVYNGAYFGPGGEGFVRLNFACPRPTLVDGLSRIKAALSNGMNGSVQKGGESGKRDR